MARLMMPPEEELTPQQKEARDEVVAGKRGKVPAPMIAWLRNPELARRTQKLGELLRYDTTLPQSLLELAIIVCARHWTAHVQWKAHKAYALQAGLDPAIAEDIAARRTPAFEDAKQRVVYEVSMALLDRSRVPTELYERAKELLGEQGLVELVTLLGYYCIASFTLNTFELGLPESVAPELDDPDYAAT
ncbi:MAG: hypothetical protein QM605_07260 [Sphingobium sp.]